MSSFKEMRWTEQQGKIAKQLCAEGKTATQIAAVVKKTRNAVIGYLHRNGVRMSDVSVKEPKKAAPKRPKAERVGGVIHRKLEKNVKKPPILKFEAIRTKDGIMGIPFLKAGFGQCRYILETAPAIVCGEPTKSISCSWCEDHYAVVFTKPEPSGRRTSEDNRSSQERLGRYRSSFVAQRSR